MGVGESGPAVGSVGGTAVAWMCSSKLPLRRSSTLIVQLVEVISEMSSEGSQPSPRSAKGAEGTRRKGASVWLW